MNKIVLFLIFAMLIPIVSASDYEIKVIDHNENPIEDAKVQLIDDSYKVRCDEKTNSLGIVECSGIASKEDYRIKVNHEDYESINDNEALENLPKSQDILVVMRPKAESDLEIVVLNEYDNGASDAIVTLKSIDTDKSPSNFETDFDIIIFPDEDAKYIAFDYEESDETGRSGKAKFKNIEFNCEYELLINKSRYKQLRTNIMMPDSARDQTLEYTIFAIGKGQVTIRLIDENQNPISGEEVALISMGTSEKWSAKTDEQGWAVLVLETPDDFEVGLDCEKYVCGKLSKVHVENKEKRVLTIPVSIKAEQPTEEEAISPEDLIIPDVPVENISNVSNENKKTVGESEKIDEMGESPSGAVLVSRPPVKNSEDANWIILIIIGVLLVFGALVVRKLKKPSKKGLRAIKV